MSRTRRRSVRPHAGTRDVDLVVDLPLLVEVEAYRTLERNFRDLGLRRATSDDGSRPSWRWERRTDGRTLVVVELLSDDPGGTVRRAVALPDQRRVSAMHITQPVADFLPEYAATTVAVARDGGGYEVVDATRRIAIRDLLTHSAGIGYGNGPGAEQWRAAGIQHWYFGHRDDPSARPYAEWRRCPWTRNRANGSCTATTPTSSAPTIARTDHDRSRLAWLARHQQRMRLFPGSYIGRDETSAGMRSPATSMLKLPSGGSGALAVST